MLINYKIALLIMFWKLSKIFYFFFISTHLEPNTSAVSSHNQLPQSTKPRAEPQLKVKQEVPNVWPGRRHSGSGEIGV